MENEKVKPSIDIHEFVTKQFNVHLNSFIVKYTLKKRLILEGLFAPYFELYHEDPYKTPLAQKLRDVWANLVGHPQFQPPKGRIDEQTFRKLIEHLFLVYEESLHLENKLPEIRAELLIPLSNLFKSIDSYWGNSYCIERINQMEIASRSKPKKEPAVAPTIPIPLPDDISPPASRSKPKKEPAVAPTIPIPLPDDISPPEIPLIERTHNIYLWYLKPFMRRFYGIAPKALIFSVFLLVILSLLQPPAFYERTPEAAKPYLDKIRDYEDFIIKTISDKIREWTRPPQQNTPRPQIPESPFKTVTPTQPPTIPAQTTPPLTTGPPQTTPAAPKIILDPLPLGYFKKYEIPNWEYDEQRFPLPDPKTYSLRVVGEYGKTKYRIFEREKKIYAFEFYNESIAEKFLNLFEERVKRYEPEPRTIEITPVVIRFRYNQAGQYNGAYFRIGSYVYYLKMEFLEPLDLEYIKGNFFGVEIISPPTTTTPPQTTLPPTTFAPPTIELPKPKYYDFERLVFKLISQERTSHGLTELSWDDKIANAARKHSEDMGVNNYFEHDSLDGRTLEDRLREETIYCSPGCGENIFMHPEALVIRIINGVEYPNYLSQDEMARSIVDGWMNSPGHRANILTNWFRSSGIGIYYSSRNGYYYVTQDFLG